MRSLTKEAPFFDALGVYFDLEMVHRTPLTGAALPSTPTPIEDDDRLFTFLAQRKKASFGSAKLPDNLLQQKDSRFEELLMLQSMADDAVFD